jgi:hypothetical protein
MGVHRPTGELTWVSINSQPLIRPGEQAPYAVLAVLKDITDRRRLEHELGQTAAELRRCRGELLRSGSPSEKENEAAGASDVQQGTETTICSRTGVMVENHTNRVDLARNGRRLLTLLRLSCKQPLRQGSTGVCGAGPRASNPRQTRLVAIGNGWSGVASTPEDPRVGGSTPSQAACGTITTRP